MLLIGLWAVGRVDFAFEHLVTVLDDARHTASHCGRSGWVAFENLSIALFFIQAEAYFLVQV